jgi:YbbR domain-containing protein
MKEIPSGEEKILPLTPDLVRAPIGVEVVRVIPARVKLTVEPLASQQVRISPRLTGTPAQGFEVESSVVTPETVQVEGPASSVLKMETISTNDIDIRGRQSTFKADVDLDLEDPIVLIQRPGPITVEVRIRPATR